ncbi:pyridoxamine 5'-phosphate oxidase family protein [Enterococcus sp. BWM-S5]|uniref:Pyridoxamine 5'-phosphate oxidase family protein n=1 Tax=Enterococcus larvae TaxID=2794352 RepID=A0ABS4CLH7_9ENTE|nr:pyridoxamine 5'-phosphate oxidase family protein [Enterococcus larvae]MBP1047323.1 pyridoxamine 5'-phosphate oxidase family protein [Enterococcus larvae]
MRRKDREILDLEKIKEIVEACHVVRLAMFDEPFPYIVPVNFGYHWQEEALTLYIHGARQGKKVRLLENNPMVAVEMDCNHELIEAGTVAEKYSYAYQSLIGFGEAFIIQELEEKKQALQLLMDHEVKHTAYNFPPDKMIAATGIIKIVLSSYSCKEHIHPNKMPPK